MKICVRRDKLLSCFGHWETVTTITVLSLVPAAADFLCTSLFCFVFFFSQLHFGQKLWFKNKGKIKSWSLTSKASFDTCLYSLKTSKNSIFCWSLERLCMLHLSDFFCLFDFFSKQICQGCHNAIDPEVQRVTYNNFNWHATEECFLCSCCSKCLIGQKFMPVEGMVFCSVECKKKMMS